MSKAGKVIKNISKKVEKVVHGNKIKTFIQAGLAAAGPPLGPILGQVSPSSQYFSYQISQKNFSLTKEEL